MCGGSVGIFVQHALQNADIRRTKTQALVEQLLVNVKVHATRELLAGDERLDNARYLPLLVDIDQRLQLDKRRQRRECREHVWVSWWAACARVRVDLHGEMGCGGIDQVGKLTKPV